jgi:GH24 family phage-related lysozyme (muramidase)
MMVDAIRARLVLPCAAFLFCLSNLQAGTTADGFVYSDNGTNITITGYTGSGGDIAIPGTINAEPVVSIGANAFSNGVSLGGVTIPTSVMSIGDNAFYGCINLTSVTIPASVTSIGVGPFQSCTQLTQVNVDAANPDYTSSGGVLFNQSLTQLIQYPDGNTQTSYSIPASVTSIGDFAFFGSNNLAGVTIPSSVTAIGNNAFASSSLTSVIIPAGVSSIGTEAFVDCAGLTQISVDPANPDYASSGGVLFNKALTQLIQYPAGNNPMSYVIPASVTTIGNAAFASAGLTGITIPGSVTSIGNNAFTSTGLTSVTIPAGVTSIGTDAFADCNLLTQINVDPANSTYASPGGVLFDKSLTQLIQYPVSNTQTSYVIPSSVVSIDEAAFFNCASLGSVTIPTSVTSIGKNAFASTGLTSVAIPAGVTSIGDYAFADCSELSQINVDATNPDYASSGGVLFDKALDQLITYPAGNTQTSYSIPNSVTAIGISAFYGSVELTTVTLPTSVASIGNEAFANCISLNSVTIPAGVTSIGEDVFTGCIGLTQVNVDAANPDYASSGGVLLNKSLTDLIQYPPRSAPASYAIPSSVVFVDFGAFFGCSNLTSLTVPSSVAAIGADAFSDCAQLTQINADAASPLFTNQGGVLFNKSLTQLITYPAANAQASYTIPSSVTDIKSYAFSGCPNLTSVTIPSSVISIEDSAFYSCSGLTSAIFQGNAPVFFGQGVFDSTAANFTIYYSQGSTGFTTPFWHGYHALPTTPASSSPSPTPKSSDASSGGGGGGGAPSLWFYGALSLLAAARRFLPKRVKQ